MYSKINYTIVGIFVLIFTIGMVWFAFWLAKYGLKEEFDYYKIQMSESVSGLSKDSTVKLHGVDVGSISEIRINPENVEKVEIIIKIKKGTPIKEDMVAFTEMYGVTGISYIQIDSGSNKAKLLKSKNGEIPVIPAEPSLMNRLGKNVGSLSERLNLFLEQTTQLFSDKNIAKLNRTFENVEKVTANAIDVEEKTAVSLGEFNKTLQDFRTKIDTMTVHFVGATDDFKTMKNVFNPTIEELMVTIKDFDRVTLKVEKSLDRGDYNLKKILEPMLVDIEVLSTQINDLAKELEQSPNDLLFRSRERRRGPGE